MARALFLFRDRAAGRAGLAGGGTRVPLSVCYSLNSASFLGTATFFNRTYCGRPLS
jgi:hypothetical protein